MGDLFQDKRFSHVGSDVCFKNLPRSQRKIKIDKRFQTIFTDKKFQLKYAVDIRGRPTRETQADSYKKYYDIASDTDEPSDDEEGKPETVDKDSANNANSKVIEIEKEKDELSETSDDDDSSNESDFKQQSEQEDAADDAGESSDDDLADKTDSIIVENKDNLSEPKSIRKADTFSATTSKKKLDKKINKEIDKLHQIKTSDEVHNRLQDMSIDYARGVGTIMSDSSSDDASSDEDDYIFVEHPWGELDKDVETTDEATKRLAICNLDWDRIYAKDLMVLLHSFLPADGVIESVSVYPSEFGLERMKEEELNGPKELFVKPSTEQEVEQEEGDDYLQDGEDNAYHLEKLREYQLNRLKYYYAVVVCNSEYAANKLYTECNGMEYESCAAKIDMRFIPDDMTFDQEPREVCTSLPDVTKYKPRLFENSALRQGKVSLTWDETDPRRIEFNKRIVAGEDLSDDDLNNYIASSSEESETEEKSNPLAAASSDDDSEGSDRKHPKDKLSKYKSLVAALKSEEEKKKNKDVEMQISWGAGKISDDRIVNKGHHLSDEQTSSSSSEDESLTKKNLKSKKLQKKNTNKVAEKISSEDEKAHAELDLLLTEDNPEENKKKHFTLKGIQNQEKESKSKKKKWRKELKKKINSNKEEDTFKVDVNDDRFSAVYTSHLFNIDPAHPQYKKSKAMDDIVTEKQKRRKIQEIEPHSPTSKKKLKPELLSLVTSIKEKTAKKN